MMHEIIVFTKPGGCHQCTELKAHLKLLGFEYTELEMMAGSLKALWDEARTYPVVNIRNEYYHYDEMMNMGKEGIYDLINSV